MPLVVMGAGFTAIVNSLVKDLLTPLIAAVAGKPDFSARLALAGGMDGGSVP